MAVHWSSRSRACGPANSRRSASADSRRSVVMEPIVPHGSDMSPGASPAAPFYSNPHPLCGPERGADPNKGCGWVALLGGGCLWRVLPSGGIVRLVWGAEWEPLEDSLVYAENFCGAMYFDDPKEVREHREAYAKLVDSALSPEDSRRLSRETAR
ncbi:Scr1 family TA system antitoxin-like transcriptional regulator [Nocardia sp. NPDC004068]|uniref:Scr1 family TA system antitoxin-like transcriptional regulator n=1 Tax=Nocardia sp. NPDC004068 TaxID=3364303 RepID=UPI00367D820C